jgi:hypothetical protein
VEQNRGPRYENSHSYAHLIVYKVAKIYDGEKTASLTNVAGETGYLPAEN